MDISLVIMHQKEIRKHFQLETTSHCLELEESITCRSRQHEWTQAEHTSTLQANRYSVLQILDAVLASAELDEDCCEERFEKKALKDLHNRLPYEIDSLIVRHIEKKDRRYKSSMHDMKGLGHQCNKLDLKYKVASTSFRVIRDPPGAA
ncbi:hypothetical protein LXL04_010256 [Taraxacum kok-saghyz]